MKLMDIKPFKEPIYIARPILPRIKEISKDLQVIWKTRQLTNNGLRHKLLEKKLCKKLKVQNISLVNNGTTALSIACKALDLSGEVITTPFTFIATTNILLWHNLTPVFCDIDSETLNIDAGKIEALITPKTSAILAVHAFGTPCDAEKIEKIAKKHKLKLIYDAAHAFGVEMNGSGIGCFGDISAFSFHATKTFHTVEGGAIVCRDPKLKRKVDLLRNFGIKNENEIVMPGINGKMNEIQASIGLVVLGYLKEELGKRKKLHEIYMHHLSGILGLRLLPLVKGASNAYQYFTVQIDAEKFGQSRDQVYKKLKKYNIFTRKYFHPLCSQYGYIKKRKFPNANNLPVATRVAKQILALPFFGGLSKRDVVKICNAVKHIKSKK